MNMLEKVDSEYVRESYDNLLRSLNEKSEDYRNHRWFKDESSFQQYKQTRTVILEILELNGKSKICKDMLEIGCGPGTWTKILSERCDRLTALDISKGMLKQARNNIKNTNVEFLLGNFLDDEPLNNMKRQFDEIYSIRAFEYFPDKKRAIKKINALLKNAGKVNIVTKNRRYLPKIIIGFMTEIGLVNRRSIWIPNKLKNLVSMYSDKLHSDQIDTDRFRKIMEDEKFKDIHIYPVIIGLNCSGIIWKFFTFIHSIIWKRYIRVLDPLMESYLIVGTKNE